MRIEGESAEESVGKRSSLCLCEKSPCLCGEITPENIHHRGTEIAQRHGERFSRQTPPRARKFMLPSFPGLTPRALCLRALRALSDNTWTKVLERIDFNE